MFNLYPSLSQKKMSAILFHCFVPQTNERSVYRNLINHIFQVVLVAQVVCWTGQFIGHGVIEKRASALRDNLVQAFVMAPFFVLLEGLQSSINYEPYPVFHARAQARIAAEKIEWEEKRQKLLNLFLNIRYQWFE